MNSIAPGGVVCVILAAGQGTRMRSSTTHKVCFPVAGRPAILRAMDAYRAAGLERFVVVVGALAGQVVETVGREFPETTFIYQPERLGTGNAARIGVAPLLTAGFTGHILVTMGDKLVNPSAVRQLLEAAGSEGADVVVGVKPREAGERGRVLLRPDGRLAGILEARDIQRASSMDAARRILQTAQDEAAAALDSPAGLDSGAARFNLGGQTFSPEQAEAAPYENTALYLFRAPALYEGLKWMTTANAKQEEYLTDAINHLAQHPGFRVSYSVLKPDEILTFNNPEELLAVEETFRRLLAGETGREAGPAELPREIYRPVREWLALLEQGGVGLQRVLSATYGPDEVVGEERRQTFRRVLLQFGEHYGWDRRVIIVRAPGRVNLLGRHVEHRGGYVNVMAISKEVVMVAAPREDDLVRVANLDQRSYPEAEFRIGAELAGLSWEDWLDFINHDRVQRLVKESRGNWVNYVKAAFLRLQFQCRDIRLRGIDALFTGNIPVAAGLSSSSAVVVASAEAAVALNGLNLAAQEFVDLCGEGEWYVGSRGGAGDHAAMKFGQLGQVTQIRFFPFSAKPGVPFPADYRLIIADSHVQARKMTNAKDMFNQRVASYDFALMLLKERFPSLAPKMERLRDVNPQTLGIRQSELYSMLRELPETLSPDEVRQLLGKRHGKDLERIMGSHAAPDRYLIRSVALYGIAECRRSEMCRDLLERNDLERLGRLMNVSHDGDRVVRFSREGSGWISRQHDYRTPDAYLDRLSEDLESQELDRVARAQLHLQPGGYACSTPEIDELVDLALEVPGVLGAQLSGAGLGGCIMVLLHRDAVDSLERTLTERFYAPRGLAPALTVSAPVRGSGLLSVG